MNRKIVIATVVAGALVLPATAAAETSAFAEAKRGNLHVLSSVIRTRSAVDLMGGWFNTAQPCSTERRLRVAVEVRRSTDSSGGVFGTSKTRKRMNCAEGGPNLGFQLSARQTGFACPNGRWRPGRYDFIIRTRHLASDVVAVASLGWVNRRAC